MTIATSDTRPQRGPHRYWIRRHAAFVRVSHWINAVCLAILLMSGLQIFNAHPALDWGSKTDFDSPPLQLGAEKTDDGRLIGVTRIFGHRFVTTGVLGVSKDADGATQVRGFPYWATIPGTPWLAMGRRWHFFFAWLFVINGALYAAYALASGHFRRDLLPTGSDLKGIGHSIREHAMLRFPKGREAERYNVLQRLTYVIVVFGLGPLIVIAGLTMSPRLDSAFPWLLDAFGGRQSARTVHFLCALGFVIFFIVHIAMVLLSGVWRNTRSMITGSFPIDEAEEPHG